MDLNRALPTWILFLLVWWLSSESEGQELDVRLFNGPSRYEGTVVYSTDGNRWNTICGEFFSLSVVKVVCRQLGFPGANRNTQNSPYGSLSSAPKSYCNCSGNEAQLENCVLRSVCSSHTPGSAKCYDERYLGCFIDKVNDRIFPVNSGFTSDKMTIELCFDYCKNSNVKYGYAGLEYTSECYCGVADANFSRHGTGSESDCQYQCSGDTTSSCGGLDFVAVFNLSVNVPINMRTTSLPEVPSSTGVSTSNYQSTISESSTTPTPCEIQRLCSKCVGVAIVFGILFGVSVMYGISVSAVLYLTSQKLKKSQKFKEEHHNYMSIRPVEQPALDQELKSTGDVNLAVTNHTYDRHIADEAHDSEYADEQNDL